MRMTGPVPGPIPVPLRRKGLPSCETVERMLFRTVFETSSDDASLDTFCGVDPFSVAVVADFTSEGVEMLLLAVRDRRFLSSDIVALATERE